MDESKISVRYSRALLSLAKEKKNQDVVKSDIQMIGQLFEAYPTFNQLLQSPVVSKEEKRKLFENVFSKSIDKMTYSFLILLLTNNREAYLKDIVRNFLEAYRRETGFKTAKMVSAIEIDPSTMEQFKILIRKYFSTEVDLECEVNPDLLGGFVLQIGDRQIDASVSAKLKKLKRELLES